MGVVQLWVGPSDAVMWHHMTLQPTVQQSNHPKSDNKHVIKWTNWTSPHVTHRQPLFSQYEHCRLRAAVAIDNGMEGWNAALTPSSTELSTLHHVTLHHMTSYDITGHTEQCGLHHMPSQHITWHARHTSSQIATLCPSKLTQWGQRSQWATHLH